MSLRRLGLAPCLLTGAFIFLTALFLTSKCPSVSDSYQRPIPRVVDERILAAAAAAGGDADPRSIDSNSPLIFIGWW